MITEDTQQYYAETKLYNDVMGIALAVWGNAGDCPIFKVMDQALDNYSLDELGYIKEGFDSLPQHLQRDIMSDVKTQSTFAAIDRLQENVTALIKTGEAQSA